MTDYKNLKLVATSSPHIRGNDTTRSIMRDVIIAMIPALVFACVWFGIRALTLTAVSVVGCAFFEWLYQKVMKKPQTVSDLSCVVTGMLLAFTCPVQMPYWMILLGDFFAIVVVKQLFGGIGKNFVNPALAGRAFIQASYASVMTTWVDPTLNKAAVIGSNVDIITTATPLSMMKGGNFETLLETYDISAMIVGQIPGTLGEVSAVALLLGGIYLLCRKVISWHIPIVYVATMAVLTFLFPGDGTGLEWMLYSIFSGGVMLCAFFMATDYATSPITKKGQVIYGIGCGLFTIMIRYFGSYNEGVCYSIMVMNLLVPLIDKYTKPTRFGVVKSDKKEAAAQ